MQPDAGDAYSKQLLRREDVVNRKPDTTLVFVNESYELLACKSRLQPIRMSGCISKVRRMRMNGIQASAIKAHLAIKVRYVEKSLEFYTKLFGIEPSKVRKGYAKFDVQNPPLNFTLNEILFGEAGALSHMGIQVSSTADVLKVRQQWAESGLITRDEMKTDCCYATQDKTWVKDPDGNEWEVFVVLEDNLPEKAVAESTCCAPTCCASAK